MSMSMNLDEFLQSGVDHARTVLDGSPTELLSAFVIQFKDAPPSDHRHAVVRRRRQGSRHLRHAHAAQDPPRPRAQLSLLV